MIAVSLAAIAALLAAVVFAAGVSEAKGGGGAKPTVTSKPSSSSSSARSGSSGVSSSGYGFRHGALSNFFLWSWLFHDFDNDDYGEEYGETNAGFGGWTVLGVGAVGIWFLIRTLRKRSAR
ncbi:MAG: hypothetical protein LC740_08005 [Actinobacteria bacterium]|nr:hypothetical protein [Actinomycetota bacterium]